MKKLILLLFFIGFMPTPASAYIDWTPRSLMEELYTESVIDSAFVFIEGGCFDMGDTFGGGDTDEKPVHEVCVDDFYLGEHEVTQGEWAKIMRNNPSHFKRCGNDCPVEQVSWNDVQEFINKLSRRVDMDYRLPTEAEWEYAAREGGKRVRFGTGKNTISPDEANFDGSSKYKKSYSRSGIYRERTVEVRSFSPNALGLYDMSGNVWEWVEDIYNRDAYSKHQRNNPIYTGSGSRRVLRGGSWYSYPEYLRAAYRNDGAPGYRGHYLGFRLARTK